jgi:hypothetical protein
VLSEVGVRLGQEGGRGGTSHRVHGLALLTCTFISRLECNNRRALCGTRIFALHRFHICLSNMQNTSHGCTLRLSIDTPKNAVVDHALLTHACMHFCPKPRKFLIHIITMHRPHRSHSRAQFSPNTSPNSTMPTLQISRSSSTSSLLKPKPPLPPSASRRSRAWPASLNATLLK